VGLQCRSLLLRVDGYYFMFRPTAPTGGIVSFRTILVIVLLFWINCPVFVVDIWIATFISDLTVYCVEFTIKTVCPLYTIVVDLIFGIIVVPY